MKILKHGGDLSFFWFRIFGYGLIIKNINKHPLLFSQRNKYVKYLLIKNIYIKILTP